MPSKPSHFCRLCGAPIVEGAKFCPSCGASLNLGSHYAQPIQPVAPPQGSQVPQAPAIPATVGGSVKLGFGFAFGVLLFVVVLTVVAGVIFAMISGAITWPFASQAMRYEGTGPSDSARFRLDGTYDATWTASPVGGEPCVFRAYIVIPGTTSYVAQVADLPVDGPSAATATRPIAVAAGDYALRIESGCSWSIRLVDR